MFQAEYRASFTKRLDKHLKYIGDPQRVVTFMTEVGEQLLRDNRHERLTETSASGSKIKRWQVRKGVYAKALGPTLAPFGDDSRSIDWCTYTIEQRRSARADEFTLVVGWEDRGRHHRDKPGKAIGLEILRIHARGLRTKRGIIKRDIFGMTPLMRRNVKRLLSRHSITTRRGIR